MLETQKLGQANQIITFAAPIGARELMGVLPGLSIKVDPSSAETAIGDQGWGGELLGNISVQHVAAWESYVTASRRPNQRQTSEAPLAEKLAELKRARFTPEGKAERVARSLGALDQDVGIDLSLEEWKWIAEDPDLEEHSEN